jgi:hypothetical protein
MVGLMDNTMSESPTHTPPTVKEWVIPALSSPHAIGEKLLNILMVNPNQVIRACRINDEILFVAVEGEKWEKVA